tara:strand:- start:2247 stop:3263 length:1017 start_codon:yes stop_codon:yes gene_type:complete
LAFLESKLGLLPILKSFIFPDAWFYGKTLSVIYIFVERDIYFLQLINIIAFLLSLYFAVIIKNKLFENSDILYPFYFIALYPIIIQYTSLTLKESLFTLFLILSIHQFIIWFEKRNLINFFLLNIFLFIDTLFYIASITAILLIWIYFIISFIINYLKYNKNNLKILSLFYLVCSIFVIYFLINFENILNLEIIYFDKINNLFNFNKWKVLLSITLQGDASYPRWIIPNNTIDIFFKIVIRFFYLLYSPFIWDIEKPSHVVGFIDSLIYLFLTLLIFLNFKKIIGNKLVFIIFFIILIEIIIFAIGTGNFGTGLRHRSKFLIFFILFAYPNFPKINIK